MGLTRKDKKVLDDLKYLIELTNEGSVPSMKASSFERISTSNLKSYDNLDHNHRKYSAIKKYHLRRITEMIESWVSQLTGEKIYRPETKQCKSSKCSNPNKRQKYESVFCMYCGKEFING